MSRSSLQSFESDNDNDLNQDDNELCSSENVLSLDDDNSTRNIPENVRQQITSERMSKHRTGTKAVIADYQAANQLKAAKRQADLEYRNEVLHRIATGATRPMLSEEVEASTKASNDSDLDDDLIDQQFLEDFRNQRLLELQSQASLPVFGECKSINKDSYVEEIDNEDPRVIVAVHIFESSVQSCIRLNRILDEIASTHSNVKFLRIEASINNIEVDLMTLPIISFYRNGETLNVLAGITQDIGEYFKKEDFEWLIDDALNRLNRHK